MNENALSEKELLFIDMIKSRMTASDTQEDFEAVVFPAVLSLDGENTNPIFENVFMYVENNQKATLQQICEYICSILPSVESVDDEDESA